MIKPAFAIILAAFVAVLSGCQSARIENGGSAGLLYDKGLELTVEMDYLAESSQFIDLMSSSPSILDAIGNMSAGDYSSPLAVYRIDIPEEAVFSALSLVSEKDFAPDLLPKGIKKAILKRCSLSAASMLNGIEGAEHLAATSVINASRSFLYDGLGSPCLFIYEYGGDFSSIVSFVPEEDGVVSAASYFIKTSSIKDLQNSSGNFAGIAESLNLSGITIEQIYPE